MDDFKEKNRSTFNVLFYLKKAKTLKNGETPICMRISINGKRAEVLIKRSIPASLWNQPKEYCNGKDRIAQELNHYIQTLRAKLLAIHREMEMDNLTITADSLRDKFTGNDHMIEIALFFIHAYFIAM